MKALVTGSSGSIGEAISEMLLNNGVEVYGTYNNNRPVKKLTENSNFHAIKVDYTKPLSRENQILDYSAFDILILSAGVNRDALIGKIDYEDIIETFAINVFSVAQILNEFTPHIINKDYVRVVILGSIVGEQGNIGQTVYAASKSALKGMFKSIIRDLIVINSNNILSGNLSYILIEPGFIESAMVAHLPQKVTDKIKARLVKKRFGRTEEIAKTIEWLLLPEAEYLHGSIIPMNGGLNL